MSLKLERLRAGVPIVDKSGAPTLAILGLLDRVFSAIEANDADQTATINRLRRMVSHTDPTTILRATENGVSVTITVLDHTRVYGDATSLAITGTVQTGLLAATYYACYYDDTTLEDTTPTFVFTTNIANASAAAADGRHWCGVILTPALSSGDTIESGGAYPVGNSLFGELA